MKNDSTSFESAIHTILSAVRPLPTEKVSLADALGRIAGEKIVAGEDAVPFARSAMDGYAVRARECAAATQDKPIELPVAGQVFAEQGESCLPPGSTVAITTGAPVPSGADAVIPHERTERRGTAIRIFAPVSPGASIFQPGEDFLCGDELIAVGEVLNPGKLALLAFAGQPELRMFRRPCVAIVCTGNELVDVAMIPAHGQVRNSNAVALSALVREAGGEPRYEGVAPDNRAALAAILDRARHDADMLITSGGASAGERDFVKSVLSESAAEFHFSHVNMRPGRPFGFAEWHGVPVCVLPGNPAAAFVCFHKLVAPAIARLAGRRNCKLPKLRARLDEDLHARSGRPHFVLARVRCEAQGFVVKPLANQCSALVRTAADANAIVTVPGSMGDSASGFRRDEMIEVEMLDLSGVFGPGPSLFCSRSTSKAKSLTEPIPTTRETELTGQSSTATS